VPASQRTEEKEAEGSGLCGAERLAGQETEENLIAKWLYRDVN